MFQEVIASISRNLYRESFVMLPAKLLQTHGYFFSESETLSLEMCSEIKNEKEDISWVPYSSVVGHLMYAIMCTQIFIMS